MRIGSLLLNLRRRFARPTLQASGNISTDFGLKNVAQSDALEMPVSEALLNLENPERLESKRLLYMQVGICIQIAQGMEDSLGVILAALDCSSVGPNTPENFESKLNRYRSLSFGQLMTDLKKRNFLPPNMVAKLGEMNGRRNYLAHHFYRKNVIKILTKGGLQLMIAELILVVNHFNDLHEEMSTWEDQAYERMGHDLAELKKGARLLKQDWLREAKVNFGHWE